MREDVERHPFFLGGLGTAAEAGRRRSPRSGLPTPAAEEKDTARRPTPAEERQR